MNRKGRISPLPQAVQGAQLQQPGPAGEPGIKSEFGRMFAGIGSGVSGIGVSSPVTSGAPMPFTNASLAKREDVETSTPESGTDGTGKPAKGRRRKLKDEDGKADDDHSGRQTPSNRAKRPKTHQHHHHQYVTRLPFEDNLLTVASHHHHHHHPADLAVAQAAGTAPFKSAKGGSVGPSPNDKPVGVHHHHHVARPVHTHHAPAVKQPVQPAPPVIPPKPKLIISSKAVLESVASLPRHHLGDFIYEPGLKAGRLLPKTPTHRAFASNPKPLPWEMIKDKENCTLTVKVSRVHLAPVSREEITARGYLWGTDVYTDDSDVVAACIHSGWIKGEWPDEVDFSTFDPESTGGENKRRKVKSTNDAIDLESEGLITTPLPSGPMPIPAHRDLHINILILPRLMKYASTNRHGITSREFGGEYGNRHAIHDGISYLIRSIRWVENGAQPQARLRGKARRERMRKAMWEVKGSFDNISGQEREQEKERINTLRGEISGNWWKKDDKSKERQNGDSLPAGDADEEKNSEDVKADAESTNKTDEPLDKDVEMVDAEATAKKNAAK